MTDSLIKALAYNNEVRIYVINATHMVEEARRLHDTWSAATAALGRAMIGTTLIGVTMKNEQDKLTMRLQGDGPIGNVIVDTNMHGQTKAYIQKPHVSLQLNEKGKLDVRGAVGTEGVLAITKDLGLKAPFVGTIPLVSGELAEDFTYYMAVSEQTPSSFGLSVVVNPDETVRIAGGFMIQVLPGVSEETVNQIEQTLKEMPPVSEILDQEQSLLKLLDALAGKENYHVLEEMPVEFSCDCSKKRFANAIIALGQAEIQSMIEEDHGAEAICHFCRSKYQFTAEELDELKAIAK